MKKTDSVLLTDHKYFPIEKCLNAEKKNPSLDKLHCSFLADKGCSVVFSFLTAQSDLLYELRKMDNDMCMYPDRFSPVGLIVCSGLSFLSSRRVLIYISH